MLTKRVHHGRTVAICIPNVSKLGFQHQRSFVVQNLMFRQQVSLPSSEITEERKIQRAYSEQYSCIKKGQALSVHGGCTGGGGAVLFAVALNTTIIDGSAWK